MTLPQKFFLVLLLLVLSPDNPISAEKIASCGRGFILKDEYIAEKTDRSDAGSEIPYTFNSIHKNIIFM